MHNTIPLGILFLFPSGHIIHSYTIVVKLSFFEPLKPYSIWERST
nr:MAG TPA: hypothetical protein [Caudoviricetes sp.]